MNYNQLISFGMSFGLDETQLEFLEYRVTNFLTNVFEMAVNFPNVNRLLLTDSFGNSIIIIRNENGKYRLSKSNQLNIFENYDDNDKYILRVKINEFYNLILEQISWNTICQQNITEIPIGCSKIVFTSEYPYSSNPKNWKIVLVPNKSY
jgi:hypothetical protein